jgi:PqqD family protein of HPr-rel-A system
MPTAGHSVWKVNGATTLHWRRYDDECVVFSSGSGDIHLLNTLAAEALRVLEEAPGAALDVAARVASRGDLELDHDLVSEIEKLLAELDRVGLIEPADG